MPGLQAARPVSFPGSVFDTPDLCLRFMDQAHPFCLRCAYPIGVDPSDHINHAGMPTGAAGEPKDECVQKPTQHRLFARIRQRVQFACGSGPFARGSSQRQKTTSQVAEGGWRRNLRQHPGPAPSGPVRTETPVAEARPKTEPSHLAPPAGHLNGVKVLPMFALTVIIVRMSAKANSAGVFGQTAFAAKQPPSIKASCSATKPGRICERLTFSNATRTIS